MKRNGKLNKGIAMLLLIMLTFLWGFPANAFAATSGSRPTVTTDGVEDVGETEATLYGTLEKNGGFSITEHGFCYGINSSNPEKKANLGSTDSKKQYSVTLTDLKPGTTYYYYYYAKNASGKGTGRVCSFTTDESEPETTVPSVRTTGVSDIEETSVTLEGILDENGGERVTDYGFCYGTNRRNPQTPVKLGRSSRTGDFSAEITGLKAGTTYYYYAYAKNANGKDTGKVLSFTTEEQAPVEERKQVEEPKQAEEPNPGEVPNTDEESVSTIPSVTTNLVSNDQETSVALEGISDENGGERANDRHVPNDDSAEPLKLRINGLTDGTIISQGETLTISATASGGYGQIGMQAYIEDIPYGAKSRKRN